MPSFNRKSVDDAQRVVERLISDEVIKSSVLSYLSDAIAYAHNLEPKNWNLNLDINGGFVRFNVGHVYCIEINPNYVLVLALKKYVPEKLVENPLNVEFVGYEGRMKVISSNFKKTLDCLKKIPGSIGCQVRYEANIALILSLLTEANRKFIEEAITQTKTSPLMKKAHSPGFIAYLSQYCHEQISNPSYINADVVSNSFENPLEEIKNYCSSYEGLQETERQAVIQSRIGQGKFRADLVQFWGRCAVTGCQKLEVLRASHIKPWRKSKNQERLDVYNGLLLTPNLDVAFDAGYISFDDDGKIIISRYLSGDDRDRLGIHLKLSISGLTKQHKKYLQYHRKHIFKDK